MVTTMIAQILQALAAYDQFPVQTTQDIRGALAVVDANLFARLPDGPDPVRIADSKKVAVIPVTPVTQSHKHGPATPSRLDASR